MDIPQRHGATWSKADMKGRHCRRPCTGGPGWSTPRGSGTGYPCPGLGTVAVRLKGVMATVLFGAWNHLKVANMVHSVWCVLYHKKNDFNWMNEWMNKLVKKHLISLKVPDGFKLVSSCVLGNWGGRSHRPAWRAGWLFAPWDLWEKESAEGLFLYNAMQIASARINLIKMVKPS